MIVKSWFWCAAFQLQARSQLHLPLESIDERDWLGDWRTFKDKIPLLLLLSVSKDAKDDDATNNVQSVPVIRPDSFCGTWSPSATISTTIIIIIMHTLRRVFLFPQRNNKPTIEAGEEEKNWSILKEHSLLNDWDAIVWSPVKRPASDLPEMEHQMQFPSNSLYLLLFLVAN